MFLEHLWQLSYDSKTIDVLRNAKYAIPFIQSLHLFGLTLVLGSVLAFNLRLLGFGMSKLTMPVLVKPLWRIAIWGLLLSIFTGIIVFIPDPARYAANIAFKTKLVVLLLAIVFHFTIFKRAVRTDEPGLRRNAIVAAVSLTLWFCVGWAGRAIAFLG